MPKKTSERTCWNCQHSGVCFLKRRVDEMLSIGSQLLTIDGHATLGLCYQDLHVILGRSCILYKENPDA